MASFLATDLFKTSGLNEIWRLQTCIRIPGNPWNNGPRTNIQQLFFTTKLDAERFAEKHNKQSGILWTKIDTFSRDV
jgi:hypothetical protein